MKTWVLATILVAAPIAASAQQPRPDPETIRGRQKISLIEGVLERAVQNGVDNFSRQLQAAAPNADGMAMLMGAPLVRGFRLERVGVFFDVQMPSLQLSMVWPLRYSQGADAAAAVVADIRSTLDKTNVDAQTRAELNQKLKQLEGQMTAAGTPRRRAAGVTSVANVQAGPTSVATTPPASPADMGVLDDPAEAWRGEVRNTLTDALLDNTGGVNIGPDEYIYVHARGVLAPDRLVADPADARTMELRIKGSDLDAYRARSITLEEARKRVIYREY